MAKFTWFSGPFESRTLGNGYYVSSRRIKYKYEVGVTVSYDFKGTDVALAKLRHLLDRTEVLQQLFRQAVIRSVVSNIRRRYISRMTRALEMQVLKENGRTVKSSPRTRMQDVKMQARLQSLFESLNEAQLDGNYELAEALRIRLGDLQDAMHKRLNDAPDGTPLQPHRLSVLAGNRFRSQMLGLMQVLSDASFIDSRVVNGELMIGIGNRRDLDRIETPSATAALTGRNTTSKYKSFWRHLEFGTGLKRKAAKDRLNPGVGPIQTWWYGPKDSSKVGLLLAGTAPMSFLTTDEGTFHPEDEQSLRTFITGALTTLLTA